MSKIKSVGSDRKGDGAGEGESLRMLTSQVVTPGVAPPRPTLVATGTGHTYIVQSKPASAQHHDMKSFAKLARPIAPAPPQQGQGLTGRTVQTSQQPNIPSIISPPLAHGSTEGLVSLNLVATTASSSSAGIPPPSHQTISVPVLPSQQQQQASVLQLAAAASNPQMQQQSLSTVVTNNSTSNNNPTVIQPPLGNSASTLPINMLRGPQGVIGGSSGQLQQTFNPGFPSHLPRGTTTLSVPKSTSNVLLRPGSSPATLQIPNAAASVVGLNTGVSPHSLPLARPSILQTIKTAIPPPSQASTRSPSPAVGGQPTPQIQPQDLSRTTFGVHGSINPVVSSTPGSQGGPHPMHITLNRLNSDLSGGHAARSQQTPVVDSSSEQLVRTTNLPFGGVKLTPGGLGPQAKVVTTQAMAGQHPMAPIKSVNLTVSNPVMLNSMNASLLTTTATSISTTSTPLSVAKVTNQRQLSMTGLSVTSASIIASHSLPSPAGASSSSTLSSLPLSSSSSNNSSQGQSLSSSMAQASTVLSAPFTGYPLSAQTASSSSISTTILGSASSSSSTSSSSSLSSSAQPSSLSLSSSSHHPIRKETQQQHNQHQSNTPLPLAAASSQQTTTGTNPNPTPGAIIIPPDFHQNRPGGSVIPMPSSMAAATLQGVSASLGTQADNRAGNVMGPKGSMWLQHFVYQSPIISQATPNIVGPGVNSHSFQTAQAKGQNLATNQLAHAMSVASSSNVRFNSSSMMVVDHHMRQQQQQQQQQQQMPLHSAFSTGTTTTSSSVSAGDKTTILTPHELVFSAASMGVGAGSRTNQPPIHYSSSMGGTNQSQQHLPVSMATGLSAVPVSNPSSSPRPSILRKRNSEAAGVVIRRPNFNLTPDNSRSHSPPRLDTNNANTGVGSPKTPSKNFSPASENSQSSTDTALSSNDAHTPTQNHHDKGKGEGDDCLENGPSSSSLPLVNNLITSNIPASPAVSHTGSLSEASPRKRARKQLLHATEELKDRISSSDEEMEISPKHRHRERDRERERERDRERDLEEKQAKEEADSIKMNEMKGEYTDTDGVRWVFEKPRPSVVLIHPDNINNKTRNNHFCRHSDVKPKEERRPTVNELCNQRGITQKVNGWKLYFTASQLEELMDVEKDLQTSFADVQTAMSRLPSVARIGHDEATKIHEMSQANIQRCQLIQTQLTEARANMVKTLEHQPRIQEILLKHTSKRPIKKKERT